MAFKLKKRGIDDAKKILVYGNDGTGKSTFAAEYCRKHGLKPIVIDIDDTNYTDCDIVDLKLTNDMKTFNQVKAVIDEIGKTNKYDTIILDGVSSLIEMLVSKDPGIKKYEVRNDRFKQILKRITASEKHIIFVGQADMQVVCNEDFQSNKLIIKVNSIVNEKYHCFIDADGKYGYEVEKFRTTETADKTPLPEPETVEKVEEPEPLGFETADTIEPTDENPVIENYARSIAKRIAMQGDKLTKRTMRAKCFELVQMGNIPSELKDEIYQYINENCPEAKEETA